MLRRPWSDEDFLLPKDPFRLSIVLILKEITTFFESVVSLKHRTILMTAYAAGLQVSEVVYLMFTDIDSKRMVIRASVCLEKPGERQLDRHAWQLMQEAAVSNPPQPQSSG